MRRTRLASLVYVSFKDKTMLQRLTKLYFGRAGGVGQKPKQGCGCPRCLPLFKRPRSSAASELHKAKSRNSLHNNRAQSAKAAEKEPIPRAEAEGAPPGKVRSKKGTPPGDSTRQGKQPTLSSRKRPRPEDSSVINSTISSSIRGAQLAGRGSREPAKRARLEMEGSRCKEASPLRRTLGSTVMQIKCWLLSFKQDWRGSTSAVKGWKPEPQSGLQGGRPLRALQNDRTSAQRVMNAQPVMSGHRQHSNFAASAQHPQVLQKPAITEQNLLIDSAFQVMIIMQSVY